MKLTPGTLEPTTSSPGFRRPSPFLWAKTLTVYGTRAAEISLAITRTLSSSLSLTSCPSHSSNVCCASWVERSILPLRHWKLPICFTPCSLAAKGGKISLIEKYQGLKKFHLLAHGMMGDSKIDMYGALKLTRLYAWVFLKLTCIPWTPLKLSCITWAPLKVNSLQMVSNGRITFICWLENGNRHFNAALYEYLWRHLPVPIAQEKSTVSVTLSSLYLPLIARAQAAQTSNCLVFLFNLGMGISTTYPWKSKNKIFLNFSTGGNSSDIYI